MTLDVAWMQNSNNQPNTYYVRTPDLNSSHVASWERVGRIYEVLFNCAVWGPVQRLACCTLCNGCLGRRRLGGKRKEDTTVGRVCIFYSAPVTDSNRRNKTRLHPTPAPDGQIYSCSLSSPTLICLCQSCCVREEMSPGGVGGGSRYGGVCVRERGLFFKMR